MNSEIKISEYGIVNHGSYMDKRFGPWEIVVNVSKVDQKYFTAASLSDPSLTIIYPFKHAMGGYASYEEAEHVRREWEILQSKYAPELTEQRKIMRELRARILNDRKMFNKKYNRTPNPKGKI